MRLPERTEASCLRACLHSVTNDACMPVQCLPHAEIESWNCQNFALRPLHRERCFLVQIEFLPRTCSTQVCRFRRKEEKNYLKHRSEGHKSDHGKCPNFEVVDLSLWKRYEHRSSTSTKLVVRAKAPSRFQVLPARGRVRAKRYIFRDVMPWHCQISCELAPTQHPLHTWPNRSRARAGRKGRVGPRT